MHFFYLNSIFFLATHDNLIHTSGYNLINLFQDCVEDTNHDPLSAPSVTSPGSLDPKLDKKKPNENVCLADNSLLVCILF